LSVNKKALKIIEVKQPNDQRMQSRGVESQTGNVRAALGRKMFLGFWIKSYKKETIG